MKWDTYLGAAGRNRLEGGLRAIAMPAISASHTAYGIGSSQKDSQTGAKLKYNFLLILSMKNFVFAPAILAILLLAGCVCEGCAGGETSVIDDANAVVTEPSFEELIAESAGMELGRVEIGEATITVEYEVEGGDSEEFNAAVSLLKAVVGTLEKKGEEKSEILLQSGKYRLYVGWEIAKQYADGSLGKGDWERMRDVS